MNKLNNLKKQRKALRSALEKERTRLAAIESEKAALAQKATLVDVSERKLGEVQAEARQVATTLEEANAQVAEMCSKYADLQASFASAEAAFAAERTEWNELREKLEREPAELRKRIQRLREEKDAKIAELQALVGGGVAPVSGHADPLPKKGAVRGLIYLPRPGLPPPIEFKDEAGHKTYEVVVAHADKSMVLFGGLGEKTPSHRMSVPVFNRHYVAVAHLIQMPVGKRQELPAVPTDRQVAAETDEFVKKMDELAKVGVLGLQEREELEKLAQAGDHHEETFFEGLAKVDEILAQANAEPQGDTQASTDVSQVKVEALVGARGTP